MDYNQLLGIGSRWSRVIARMTDMQEQPGVGALAPELFPVIVLESDPVDMGIHKGLRRYATVPTAPAVVAALSFIQLALPTLVSPQTQGIVATFEGIWNSGGGQQLTARTDAAVIGGGSRGFPMDSREFAAGASQVLIVLGSNAVQSGNTIDLIQASVAGQEFFRDHTVVERLVLTPGHNLTIWGSVVNTAVGATITWRERLATAAELALA